MTKSSRSWGRRPRGGQARANEGEEAADPRHRDERSGEQAEKETAPAGSPQRARREHRRPSAGERDREPQGRPSRRRGQPENQAPGRPREVPDRGPRDARPGAEARGPRRHRARPPGTERPAPRREAAHFDRDPERRGRRRPQPGGSGYPDGNRLARGGPADTRSGRPSWSDPTAQRSARHRPRRGPGEEPTPAPGFRYRQRPGGQPPGPERERGGRGRPGPDGRSPFTRRKLRSAPDLNTATLTDRRERRGGHAERPARRSDRGHPAQVRERSAPALAPALRTPRDLVGEAEGVLELSDRGFGFLRQTRRMYHPTAEDVFVPPGLIRELKLREGLRLAGGASRARNGGLELARVDTVNGHSIDVYERLKPLEDLTPTDPDERLRFATGPEPVTTRVVDLITPIGKGQRALIVAPPRTGKTVLLQQMAHGISENHPEVLLKVLLIDERPEEVTDMKRTVRGEVVASSSDMNSDAHVRVAELVLEQSRREVEFGHDVVIFLDSLTRLGRAYNRETGSSGRTLTGGIDARALERPKRIFGAARNIEHGGSLTIIATALIDTGSRMDEVIFQEFKGTGNMEMVLDRSIADMRIWPAVDIRLSGTRKEEKLYTAQELPRIRELRRLLSPLDPLAAIQELLRKLDFWEGNEARAAGRMTSVF